MSNSNTGQYNLTINPDLKSLIPPLTPDEFSQLEANVLADGIRDPIIVWSGTIVDGHNRYELAQRHGLKFETLEMHFSSINYCKLWIAENQLGRRNLTDFVKAEVMNIITACLKEIAELKKIEDGKKARDKQLGVLSIIDKTPTHDTRKIVADKLGWSTGKVAQFDVVNKKAPEEVKEKLRSGEVSINQAYQEIKKEEKKEERKLKLQEQRDLIASGSLELPSGVFEVIVIDPPWNYGRDYDPDSSRVANPYPEMSQSELLSINLPSADDSVLFLWTTHAFLWDAKQLLDGWGFTYKATLVWDKQQMGMGAWLRMQCEFCLVGIKGKPVWSNTRWRDIISEQRREHSRKPESFYNLVEEVTVGRKLEYFSRQKRAGWEVFGDEC